MKKEITEIADYFGYEQQKNMLIEEQAELIQALNKFDRKGTEESENPILYVANDDEIALINRGGAIRLTLQDALAIAGELMDILNDYQSFLKERRQFV